MTTNGLRAVAAPLMATALGVVLLATATDACAQQRRIKSNPALREPVQIGFELPISSVSGDSTTWLYTPALNVAWTFRSNLSAGVQGLTFGSAALAAGERSHFGFMPYIENFRFVSPITQLFGMAGIGWQSRSGAGLPDATGITAVLGGGARFWVNRHFSLGLLMRFHHVLSSGWLMTPRVLPNCATIASGGFMV